MRSEDIVGHRARASLYACVWPYPRSCLQNAAEFAHVKLSCAKSKNSKPSSSLFAGTLRARAWCRPHFALGRTRGRPPNALRRRAASVAVLVARRAAGGLRCRGLPLPARLGSFWCQRPAGLGERRGGMPRVRGARSRRRGGAACARAARAPDGPKPLPQGPLA